MCSSITISLTINEAPLTVSVLKHRRLKKRYPSVGVGVGVRGVVALRQGSGDMVRLVPGALKK